MAEDLEQELRTGLGQREEPGLFDRWELESGEPLLDGRQTPLVPGPDQLVCERGGRDEADGQPSLVGDAAGIEGDLGLASRAEARCDHILAPPNLIAECQPVNEVLVQPGDGPRVEGVQALCGGQASRPYPPFHCVMMAVQQLEL